MYAKGKGRSMTEKIGSREFDLFLTLICSVFNFVYTSN